MKETRKSWKNSNTGDVIQSQEFTETSVQFPVFYYRDNKSIETPNLTGYVVISEKKYNRIIRKSKKSQNGKSKL